MLMRDPATIKSLSLIVIKPLTFMKSIRSVSCHILFLLALIVSFAVQAQPDKNEILRLRNAYNTALKNYDHELSLSFLTDGVLSTISNGTLIQGKQNLREYIRNSSGTKMYWVRTPKEIDVNTDLGLAWETGSWKGYAAGSDEKSVTGGKYSAQWIKVNGAWKVNAELFVKLE
jgi:ketosteroid isomerase-like protein